MAAIAATLVVVGVVLSLPGTEDMKSPAFSLNGMSAAASVGGVFLLLTWLYIGGVVIILGAVINYVLME